MDRIVIKATDYINNINVTYSKINSVRLNTAQPDSCTRIPDVVGKSKNLLTFVSDWFL